MADRSRLSCMLIAICIRYLDGAHARKRAQLTVVVKVEYQDATLQLIADY